VRSRVIVSCSAGCRLSMLTPYTRHGVLVAASVEDEGVEVADRIGIATDICDCTGCTSGRGVGQTAWETTPVMFETRPPAGLGGSSSGRRQDWKLKPGASLALSPRVAVGVPLFVRPVHS